MRDNVLFSGRRDSPVEPQGSLPLQNPRPWDLRAGQAYTEYLVILLFGVFLSLGVAVVDSKILPEELRIMDRFYGYIFDYYGAVANFLNLPFF